MIANFSSKNQKQGYSIFSIICKHTCGHRYYMNSRTHILTLLIGIVLGVVLTRVTSFFAIKYHIGDMDSLSEWYVANYSYGVNISQQYQQLYDSSFEHVPTTPAITELHQHNKTEYEARLLCFVLTAPKNHKKKARHIKATWGQRFDTLLFMSSEKDPELPTVHLNTEGYNNLWGKVKEAFKYVYYHYNGTYDWVMKSDDDTYVVVENLRYMLREYDPNLPYYLGCRYKAYVKQGYMQGGAGYVLSKEAVRRLVVDGLDSHKCSEGTTGAEDVQISRCLEALGIAPSDTRDSHGRGTFLPYNPHLYLSPDSNPRFWPGHWAAFYYPRSEGPYCSDRAVAFHYVDPGQMYLFDYLLYTLRHTTRQSQYIDTNWSTRVQL